VSVTNEEIKIKLLDARRAETELRSVRKELEGVTGSTEKHSKAAEKDAEKVGLMSRGFSGLTSALGYSAGLIGLGAVGYGLKDVVQGGIQAQEQQVLLQNALKDTGQQGAKHLSLIQKSIDHTSTHGGFSALEETEGIAQLIRRSKSATEAVKLNAEAVTFARGAHMGYATSLRMVSQIQTGNTGRLQKYLGIIQPVKYYVDQLTASEKKRNPELVKKAELLDKEATAQEGNRRILERYGGAIAAYNNTAAGSVNNAKNAIELLERNLGRDLLPTITEVAKDLSGLLVEIEEGHGVWGTLGHDAENVSHDLKEVWQFFEKNKAAAEALKYALGVIGVLALAEKVLKLEKALKGLEIVQGISKGLGGLGAATATAGEEIGGETAIFGASGGLLGAALAVGFGAALVPASAKVLKEVQELFHPGSGRQHSLQEVEALAPGSAQEANALKAKYGAPRITELKGTAIGGAVSPSMAAAISHFLEHPNLLTPSAVAGMSPLERSKIRDAYTRAEHEGSHIKIPITLELDGKVVAHVVGDHAIRDPKVARKFAEGTMKHVLSKAARE
jgi:hypothetical protein